MIFCVFTLLVANVNETFATTAKNKPLKAVAAKTAKRSSTSVVVNTLLHGIGAPSASLGVNGDFYIDTITMNIYGPKSKKAWPVPKSLIGPQGVAGVAGKQGANGKDGRDGTNGKDGLNGKDGERGAVGASGSGSGIPGPAGATGPAGAVGPAGPAGAQGATGPAGATGAQGIPGVAGTAGAQGEIGPRGLQGIQGDAGATGATGPAGATGATGATGAQGIQGIQGVAGSVGPTGPARVIHGDTTSLTLSTSSAGSGVTSQPIVTYQPNKKYYFTIKQLGAIGSTQNRKYFGMEVFATNVTNLKYSVTITEAFSYRASTAIHEYIFQAEGTFSTLASAGDLSFSIIDGVGITGSSTMNLSGSYQLIETNDLTRIDQTSPATAIG